MTRQVFYHGKQLAALSRWSYWKYNVEQGVRKRAQYFGLTRFP